MNAKIAIGIVVVVLVGAGIIAGVSMNAKKSDQTTVADQPTTQTTPTPSSSTDQTSNSDTKTETKSFKDLVMGGAKLECTFSNTDQSAAKIDGTLYTNGTMLAGNYTGQASGMDIHGHLVVRDEYMYTWMDNLPMAIKVKLDASAKPQGNSSGMDYDQKVNVSCKPWTEDSSVFNLPAGKDFQEIKTSTDASGKVKVDTGAGSNAMQCAACASLSGEAKTQCMSALNCK